MKMPGGERESKIARNETLEAQDLGGAGGEARG